MMAQRKLKSFQNGLLTKTKIKDIECLANRIYRVKLDVPKVHSYTFGEET